MNLKNLSLNFFLWCTTLLVCFQIEKIESHGYMTYPVSRTYAIDISSCPSCGNHAEGQGPCKSSAGPPTIAWPAGSTQNISWSIYIPHSPGFCAFQWATSQSSLGDGVGGVDLASHSTTCGDATGNFYQNIIIPSNIPTGTTGVVQWFWNGASQLYYDCVDVCIGSDLNTCLNPSTSTPTTITPSTATPTTPSATTQTPTTPNPSTALPSSAIPTTSTPSPTTPTPTTVTVTPSTATPSTPSPSTATSTTPVPTTPTPSTATPTTPIPTTAIPSTVTPSTATPSTATSSTPTATTATATTATPSTATPSTATPTATPSTAKPSTATPSTASPTTGSPSTATPTTKTATTATPSTPSSSTTNNPTTAPTAATTSTPTTVAPSTASSTPSTLAPSTSNPATSGSISNTSITLQFGPFSSNPLTSNTLEVQTLYVLNLALVGSGVTINTASVTTSYNPMNGLVSVVIPLSNGSGSGWSSVISRLLSPTSSLRSLPQLVVVYDSSNYNNDNNNNNNNPTPPAADSASSSFSISSYLSGYSTLQLALMFGIGGFLLFFLIIIWCVFCRRNNGSAPRLHIGESSYTFGKRKDGGRTSPFGLFSSDSPFIIDNSNKMDDGIITTRDINYSLPITMGLGQDEQSNEVISPLHAYQI